MGSQPSAQRCACYQVSLPYPSTALPPPSFPTRAGSSITIDSRSGGSLTENNVHRWTGKKLVVNRRYRYRRISIDTLPDNVLLEIFDLCADEVPFTKKAIEAWWQSLVQVCPRWRNVVFGSPRRLKLRLVCTSRTRARDTLDVWPTLPLFIRCHGGYTTESVDNFIAVLKRSGRVCQINLKDVPSSHLEKISAVMQEPFPELAELVLWPNDETVPVLPDSFLGGSAPRLQFLGLERIPFPSLPKLLLSAGHLVTLHLHSIPHSGYISPDAMVTALSTLTRLVSLCLEFQSPLSRPDLASRPPPSTHAVLPVLAIFEFKGVSDYLDDLVAPINAPRLKKLSITFFNQILFDTPQLIQFICRSPRLKAPKRANVVFEVGGAKVDLSSQTSDYGELNVKVLCREVDWQVSSLEQLCTSCLPPLFTVADLYIYHTSHRRIVWQDNIENSLWLEPLLSFTTLKNLYLSQDFASRIVSALQEPVGGITTEVLPTLQNIFLEGLRHSEPVPEAIGQFVAMRQVTGHPIVVSPWDNSKQHKGPTNATIRILSQ